MGSADILCIQGRQHKVKIYHSANSQLCYVEAAMRTFFQMFPLEPQHACAVVVSKDYGCTSEVLDIVSIISASSKLFLDISDQREAVAEVRRKFRHPSGDYMTILNVVRAYRETAASEKEHARREWCRKHFLNERTLLEARDIREQLVVTCGRVGIDPAASTKENEDPVIRNMGSWVVCEFYVYPARRVLQTNYGTICTCFSHLYQNKKIFIPSQRLLKSTLVLRCVIKKGPCYHI